MEGGSLLFTGQDDADTRQLPLEFLQANWEKISSMMPSEEEPLTWAPSCRALGVRIVMRNPGINSQRFLSHG